MVKQMIKPSKLTFSCSAPAKLILSGEHSILYHCPALSIALPLFSHCHAEFSVNQDNNPNNLVTQFQIDLKDFGRSQYFSHTEWLTKFEQIETRYNQFLANQLSIDQVLNHPEDLIICCIGIFNQQFPLASGNWALSISSEIPVGRGLGSSASIILSVLYALMQSLDEQPEHHNILDLARTIESRQHGKSSGLDPITIQQGGLIEYRMNQPLKSHSFKNLSGWLIDTGEPLSTTGEAVLQVRNNFQGDAELWQQFNSTTSSLLNGLAAQNLAQIQQAITRNQSLLEKIGVVPHVVAEFIAKLTQKFSGVAKVCGSGAVKGNAAGVVLYLSDSEPKSLCEEYGYSYQAISIETLGVRCRDHQ